MHKAHKTGLLWLFSQMNYHW